MGSSLVFQEFLWMWPSFQIKWQPGRSWVVLEGPTQLFSRVWVAGVAIWARKPDQRLLSYPLCLEGSEHQTLLLFAQKQTYSLTSIFMKVVDSFIRILFSIKLLFIEEIPDSFIKHAGSAPHLKWNLMISLKQLHLSQWRQMKLNRLLGDFTSWEHSGEKLHLINS